MITSKEMLSSILKSTQMGQIGIRSVMKAPVGSDLRSALQTQLKEYDAIETQAHRIAARRSWEVPELNHGIRMMTDMMTKMKLMHDSSDSKVAEMMIQGSTKGVISSIRDLHAYHQQDLDVSDLSRKLLTIEEANIQQMEDYL